MSFISWYILKWLQAVDSINGEVIFSIRSTFLYTPENVSSMIDEVAQKISITPHIIHVGMEAYKRTRLLYNKHGFFSSIFRSTSEISRMRIFI